MTCWMSTMNEYYHEYYPIISVGIGISSKYFGPFFQVQVLIKMLVSGHHYLKIKIYLKKFILIFHLLKTQSENWHDCNCDCTIN